MLKPRFFKSLICLVLLSILFGCSDPDEEEGGIIGTGLRLEGTVTEIREFASNTLQIKATSGELTEATIDDTGRYIAASVKGEAPFLLRADLGNSEYRYGIAFDTDRANVHSYTDVILRNWFESNNNDIDNSFEQAVLNAGLPTKAQYKSNANHIFDLTELVLDSYGITGEELLTGDYESGLGQDGIDRYLRSNPAIIQNGIISFVITEPVNQTQSTTRSSFSVFELASEPDTQTPEVPESIRALPSASNEIVIVWEPASDNRGVVAYQVFRDGVVIATTPYPVYVDSSTDLIDRQLYSYQVVAVDASENTSALSAVAISSTLDGPDTIAPPVPVQLSVSAEIGRMELIWGQMNIGDVVSFDVYRGTEPNQTVFFKSVTSTIMTDVSVSSGVQYCYQIVAKDASANESDRSSIVCETAEGQEVTRSTSPLASSVPPLAGLSIPDTGAMTCNTLWDDFTISDLVNVDAGCYQVDQTISIEDGGTLNLNPGVVMKFGAGTIVNIGRGGVLSSMGTKDDPVLLTAQDPTPGYWNGLAYRNSNSFSNELLNTIVEYAGSSVWGAAIALVSDSSARSALSVTDSVVRQCSGAGIKIVGLDSDLRTLEGSVITECEFPLEIGIAQLEGVSQLNSFSGNENDWVDIGSTIIEDEQQLKDLGVPYVAGNIVVNTGASLSVLPGVEIQFRTGSVFNVFGNMSSTGEIDRRVLFTGSREEPGHWEGLYFNDGGSLSSTDIKFAGAANSVRQQSGSLVFQNILNAKLDDVSIEDGSSFGLNVVNETGTESTLVDGIRFYRNANSIRIPIGLSKLIGKNNEFIDNRLNDVVLFNGSVEFKIIDLYDIGAAYAVQGSLRFDSGALRVHAGVNIHMGDDSAIILNNGAYISIAGSESEPVVLTHTNKIAGSWRGIQINSRSASNLISNAQILYAGAPTELNSASISLICSEGTRLSMDNTSIEDSAGWGVFSSGPDECGPEFGQNMQFFRNSLGDIGFEN